MSYAKHMAGIQGTTVSRTDAGLASTLQVSVMRLRRRLVAERDPGNDLSIGQMAVLGALGAKGELTVGELAAHERVQPPSMTRIVGHLEVAGLAVREVDAQDRRIVRVHITDSGRQTLERSRTRKTAFLAKRVARLTPDARAALAESLPVLEALLDD